MKTQTFLSLLLSSALCAAPAFADGDAPRAAEDKGGPSAEAAAPAHVAADKGGPSAEAAPAASEPLSPEQRTALRKEMFELQKEIRPARLEAGKAEDVQAIRAKIEALGENGNPDEIRKLSAEARRLTERHLAEQPGMADKLARLREIGQELRRDLPAEMRRRGRRLPEKAPPEMRPDSPEARPAEAAPAETTPAN